MTTARPSWPPSREAVADFIEDHFQGLDLNDNGEVERLVYAVLAHFTPPAPEVASEERTLLEEEVDELLDCIAHDFPPEFKPPKSMVGRVARLQGHAEYVRAARKEEKP